MLQINFWLLLCVFYIPDVATLSKSEVWNAYCVPFAAGQRLVPTVRFRESEVNSLLVSVCVNIDNWTLPPPLESGLMSLFSHATLKRVHHEEYSSRC